MSEIRKTVSASNYKYICGRIIEKRKSLNLKQSDIAKALGVSSRTIIRLEAGDDGVGIGTFLGVCRLLGMSLSLGDLPTGTVRLSAGKNKLNKG